MKHSVHEEQGTVVVAFEGDVDLETSPTARIVLLEAVDGSAPVLVDLSGVSYIDSSGVASLVEALQKARKGGGTFVLASVSETAMRVLQLARLDKVFTIYPTLAVALTKVR